MSSETDGYWASPTKDGGVYHVDPDCPRLKSEPVPMSPDRFPDRDVCKFCTGEWEAQNGPIDPSIAILEAADPDDYP